MKIPSRPKLIYGFVFILAASTLGLIAIDRGLLDDPAEVEFDNQNDTEYNISVYYSPAKSETDVTYAATVNNQTQQYDTLPSVPVGKNVDHVEPTNSELLEKIRTGPKQETINRFDNWGQDGTYIYIVESSNGDVVNVDAMHCSSGNPKYRYTANTSGQSISSWSCNDRLF